MLNFPERITIGFLFFFGVISIAVLWMLAITWIYWNMDPKFGGPYRWATFAMSDYWAISLLPSTGLVLLSIAARYRWRVLIGGGIAYRYFGDLSALIVTAFLMRAVLWLNRTSGLDIELVDRYHPLSQIQFHLFSTIVVLILLVFPLPVRGWVVVLISYLTIFCPGRSLSNG